MNCWIKAPPDFPKGLQTTSIAALPLTCYHDQKELRTKATNEYEGFIKLNIRFSFGNIIAIINKSVKSYYVHLHDFWYMIMSLSLDQSHLSQCFRDIDTTRVKDKSAQYLSHRAKFNTGSSFQHQRN
jgi:hypothetical protein